MQKQLIIEHLKKLIVNIKKLNKDDDIRVYVHINKKMCVTDVEVGHGITRTV